MNLVQVPPGMDGAYAVDVRGGMGVQVGAGNTQIIYAYGNRTWSDGVTPPPLVSVSGEVASPYRGLGAFEERDAAFFFGREEVAARLLERMSGLLDGQGLLVVSGASGAGKSSLLRAGVLPRLRGAGLALAPDAASWPCLVLSPGRAPLDELAVRVALLAGTEAAAVRRELDADPARFALTARQAAGLDPPPGRRHRRLLLVVDQFEQVFTQCVDVDERRAFITALSAAADAGRGRGGAPAALVVLGVRADFEARCASYPEPAGAVQERYLVTPMTGWQLRMAVTEPAKVAGSRVDDDLADSLLAEVGGRQPDGPGAGVLPLLSHALDQAWRSRAGHALTLADYGRTGGIEGAVAASAERAYGRLTPGQQSAARQVFTRLAATSADGTDTADRATRAELTEGRTPAQAADVEAVLEAFAAERLLTLAADSVEVSHEALLTAWPLLRDTWLAETHADRITRTRLRATAAEWAHSRDPSYLYRGTLLHAADAIGKQAAADPVRNPPLGPAERDFLRASARRRAARWRQAAIAGLAILTLAAVTIAGIAINNAGIATRNAANAARQHAIALSRQLAAQSEVTSPQGRVVAGRLAAAAWWAAPTDEAFASMRALLAQPRPVLYGHAAGVTDVAFSPNGRLLASASNDQTIRLWDPVTGLPVGRPLEGHADKVVRLAFSPDGRLLASASDDGTVRLWDPTTGKQAGRPLTGHKGAVRDVAFSPDGRLLASAGDDGTVRLWDPTTGKQARRPLTGHNGAVTAVAFSPDGRLLASAVRNTVGDGVIQLWNPVTRRLVHRPLTGHADWIWSVAFSPDGRLLASASLDKTIRLWNPSNGNEVGPVLSGHADGVTSVAFSPDGRLLASASLDKTIRLWNPATGKPAGPPLTGHTDQTWSVAFSPDGRLLASASFDGSVRLWDPATGQPVSQSLTGNRGYLLNGVAFSPDGRLLATANLNDRAVSLWDPATGRPAGQPLADHTQGVTAVAFSPNGGLLASASLDKTIRLWNPATGKPVRALTGHAGPVNAVSFSPDGRLLASGGEDGTVRLWDPATGKQAGRPLTGHVGAVPAVAFSPDGRLLASGGEDGTVRLWDPATGKQAGRPLTGHVGAVPAVAFSPDGRLLATGDDDGTVRLWDPVTGQQVGRSLSGPPEVTGGSVIGVAFSPDGKLLAHFSLLTLSLTDRDILADTPGAICSLFGSPTRGEWNTYLHGEPFTKVCP